MTPQTLSIYGPWETVSFVFPRVLIRTQGKTKLTSFPRDHTLSVLLYFPLTLSLPRGLPLTGKIVWR